MIFKGFRTKIGYTGLGFLAGVKGSRLSVE